MNRTPIIRDSNGLNMNQLKTAAPSVFATKASPKMSDRYAFVPTIDLIKPLLDDGFRVVEAQQRATTKRDPRYTRHALRLRAPNVKPMVGDTFPELVVTNSHDGQSRYIIRGGLYRLICSNGMVTGVAAMSFATAHRGDSGEILKSALEVTRKTVDLEKTLARWSKLKLSDANQAKLAAAAAKLAYDKPGFDPKLLLNVRRTEDAGSDLWSVFNRIQENIITGGVSFESRASHRTFRTRGITHIGRNIELNQGLWELAEKLAA